DRADKILFTKPYHVRQAYLMEDSTHPIGKINSITDLKNLKIGIIDDVYYQKLLNENGVTVSTYSSISSQTQALALGWVDVIIGPQLSLGYQASKAGFHSLKIVGTAP